MGQVVELELARLERLRRDRKRLKGLVLALVQLVERLTKKQAR